jgi:hypothetical protein
MNKIGPKSVEILIWLLAIVAIIGYSLSGLAIINTSLHLNFFSKPLCLEEACVQLWAKANEYSLAIAKTTSDLLVALATAGGIVVALMSYVSNVSNSALANHINHYAIFQSYVNNEIEKRSRIEASSIDIFLWYNAIFRESRVGVMSVSGEYHKFVKELNEKISASNNQAKSAKDGTFRYTLHQAQIKEQMKIIGIIISSQPRNDFYEIEDQVFSLISAVNQSFCFSTKIPPLVTRAYV